MSKIQKALKALKNSQSSVDSGDSSARAIEVAKKKELRAQRNHRSGGIQKSLYADADSSIQLDGLSIVPGSSIEVPIAKFENSGLMPRGEDAGVISQQFRRIKRPIIQSAFESNLPVEENPNVIMMASALPGAGKSFCAFNLAHSISSERDLGAVLVDADVLKPGISREFGLQDNVGLIDYLIDSTISLDEILVQTDLNNIIVIPAGQRHPEATELLASRRMKELVTLLSNVYRDRAVIFDMPPLLLTNEAQVLAGQAGQIVMVIEARVTSQDSVLRALAMLDRQKPVNAILNKSRSALNGGYQGDDYGYYSYSAGSDGVDNNA